MRDATEVKQLHTSRDAYQVWINLSLWKVPKEGSTCHGEFIPTARGDGSEKGVLGATQGKKQKISSMNRPSNLFLAYLFCWEPHEWT